MGDHKTNSNSSGDTPDNPQNNITPSNHGGATNSPLRLYVAEIITAGAVGTGVWVWGEHLSSHGHNALGATFNFIAFAIYFATVPITANKIWKRALMVWSIFAFFFLLMAVLFFLSSGSKPQPRVEIGFEMSETNFIWLTNDCLKSPQLANEAKWFAELNLSNQMPWLVVPISEKQSRIELNPMISNAPNMQAEKVIVHITIGTPAKCFADNDWKITYNAETTNVDFRWKTEYIRPASSSLMSRISISLPIDPYNRFQANRVPVAVRIQSENGPSKAMLFWLLTLSNTPSIKAPFTLFCPEQLTFGTNTVGLPVGISN